MGFPDLGRSGFADHTLRPLVDDLSRTRKFIFLLDEKPVLVPGLIRTSVHADEHPATPELFALQPKLLVSLPVAFFRISRRDPGASVPDDHVPSSVLPLRDDPFKSAVLEGVVLHMGGQALDRGVERRSFGNGPTLKHPVQFEAEIVMEPGGMVLLDDE